MRTQTLLSILAFTALMNLLACPTGNAAPFHPADYCGSETLYDPANKTCVASDRREAAVDPCGPVAEIPQDHLLTHQSFESHWYSGGSYGSDAFDAWIFLADMRTPRGNQPDYTAGSIWNARTQFPNEPFSTVFSDAESRHGRESLMVQNPTADNLSEQEGVAFSLSRLLSRNARYAVAVWLKTGYGEAPVTLGIGGYGTRGVPPGFSRLQDWHATDQWSCHSYEWYESQTNDEEWPVPNTVNRHLQIGFGLLPAGVRLYVDSFRLVRTD